MKKLLRGSRGFTILEMAVTSALVGLVLPVLMLVLVTTSEQAPKVTNRLINTGDLDNARLWVMNDARAAESFTPLAEPEYGYFQWTDYSGATPQSVKVTYLHQNGMLMRKVEVDGVVESQTAVAKNIYAYGDVSFLWFPSQSYIQLTMTASAESPGTIEIHSETQDLTAALRTISADESSQIAPAYPGLLVANKGTDQVKRYNRYTGIFIDDFALPGPADPTFMTIGPDGSLYVSSKDDDEVKRYNGRTGEFIDYFAYGNGLDAPQGLAFGPDGNLYVSSSGNDAIYRFDGTTGQFMDVFANDGGLNDPMGLVFGPDGDLYVASQASRSVKRYDGVTGDYIGDFASVGISPVDLLFGPDGNLYVSGDEYVKRYDGTTGEFIDNFTYGGALVNATGLAFGPDGNLYVASSGTNVVKKFDGVVGYFLGNFTSGGNMDNPIDIMFLYTGPVPQNTGPSSCLPPPPAGFVCYFVPLGLSPEVIVGEHEGGDVPQLWYPDGKYFDVESENPDPPEKRVEFIVGSDVIDFPETIDTIRVRFTGMGTNAGGSPNQVALEFYVDYGLGFPAEPDSTYQFTRARNLETHEFDLGQAAVDYLNSLPPEERSLRMTVVGTNTPEFHLLTDQIVFMVSGS